MRVVINGWFLSRSDTGSGQYLDALIRHLPLQNTDLDLHIVTPYPSLPFPGLNLHYRAAGKSPLAKIRFEQVEIPRVARELQADVVHIPYWAPPLRSPSPIVVTVHDIIPLLLPEHRGSLLDRCYTAMSVAGTRGASQVISDSHSSHRDIVNHLHIPAKRVHTVYLAAPKNFFPPTNPEVCENLRTKYRLPESYVLYLGGFHKRKNVHHLLTAWTWAHSSMPDGCHLVIAGSLPKQKTGRFFHDLPAIATTQESSESVHFIGRIDEADKLKLYQGASCFVFPSTYEGFGLPPLEAMACGVPVVTTGAASLSEVVGDAAYLVSDPSDARKLGAAIISVIVDTDLATELRTRGSKQAARFSWSKTARNPLRIYQLANN